MSVKINMSAKKDMSLLSLKRRFPTIESVLVDASFVSLYRFKKRRDRTKFWVKENVTGPMFVVQHTCDKPGVIDHSIVVLNQEGRIDFSLAINSISIIIPQEEFLMLRYLNQSKTVSTMAIWLQDYKQRDNIINCVFSSMGCRVGEVTPCDPYMDHRAPSIMESPPPQPQFTSSSTTSTPSSKSSMSARDKLLNVIRPSKESDFPTDTEISGKKKGKSESVVTISNGHTTQPVNTFSNKSGLQLLAKLKPSSPSRGDSAESKVSFSSHEKQDGSSSSSGARVNGSTSPSKSSLSLSPLNLSTNLTDDSRDGTASSSSSSSTLPPAMMPEQQPSQSLLHPMYHPHHPHYQGHPGMVMMYPPNMPMPYPGYPPNMPYPVPVYPVPPYSQPLRGSPYDPTPMQQYPTMQSRSSPSSSHHASHGYPLPSEGAVSYLMSRFGKPHNYNINDPGK